MAQLTIVQLKLIFIEGSNYHLNKVNSKNFTLPTLKYYEISALKMGCLFHRGHSHRVTVSLISLLSLL